MHIEKTQGITLQSIDYKERQRIITVYTQEYGLISLIVKGLSPKKPFLLALTSPFCLANFIYKKGRSDIYFMHDATILDEHLFLRKDLEYITNACLMAKAILNSQMPHKKSYSLYCLLTRYLQKIPQFSSQNALLVSFLLKTLLHEGLLSIKTTCNVCDKASSFIQKGESLCSFHHTAYGHSFFTEELALLQKLSFVRSFSDLEKIKVNTEIKEKTLLLFKDLI